MNILSKSQATQNVIERYDYEQSKQKMAYKVNESLGLKGGGNLCIAQGRVLYKAQQDARRNEVMDVPDSFYTAGC